MSSLLFSVLVVDFAGVIEDSKGNLTIKVEVSIEAWLAYARGEDCKAEAIGKAT
jgi:hypothetical protein